MRDAPDGNEEPTSVEEDRRERYQELLQELRVVLPGVQVFFAFLLTAPFSSAFADLDDLARLGYAISVSSSALAVIVFATPVAYHHVRDRQERGDRIETTIRLKMVGLALTGIAASSGLLVVIRFAFGPRWGWVAVTGMTLAWVTLWFVLPAGQEADDSLDDPR